MEDTIAAISTPLGIGAVSIIRLSGIDAIKIANKIYKGGNLLNAPTHTIHYGHIFYENEIIDEVLISIMKSPRTYTKEDVVEINCHGGIATTKKVLEVLLMNGARLAEPGEFTKRAFLNGRIDLSKAEGVMNLIEAKTEAARKISINQLSGKVSDKIKEIRENIVNILTNIEVNIDYPEYEDIEEITLEMIKPEIKKLKEMVDKIIKDSENAKLFTEGIKTSIIGRPNVGKSSLLNALLEEEKAIVTDIEGTTRDTVEGKINLDGILLNIIDTAGIRNTENLVEKIGVEKSKKLLNDSDLVLYVLNNNDFLSEDDMEILNLLKNKNHIVIINKMDLERKLDLSKIKEDVVCLSIINNSGIEELKEKIKTIFNLEKIQLNDMTYLSNSLSISTLKQIKSRINDIEDAIINNTPIDLIGIDLKEIWTKLGELIGVNYENELIDKLFSKFCLGK